MTTKELENKLKISENTCIHCSTLELAKKVLDIFHKLGLKWCDETNYTKHTYWDNYKENTVYCPFEGDISSLRFTTSIDRKIISPEEFIALHTEEKEFDLENYEPKGQLEGFPKEVIKRILECQEEQGNKRDVTVFEERASTGCIYKGFDWDKAKEEGHFWFKVIKEKNFNVFFEKYPKKEDTSQEFKVGDKVYDILLKEIGVVQDIVHSSSIPYGLSVEFKSGVKSYTINGCYIPEYKNPHLLHYRNDYNYDIIDFNNLPQRQEVKRYRAEVGEKYYYLDIYFEVHSFLEEYSNTDTKLYKTGNYFQTKEEAQKIADQMNTYFQKIVKIDLENSNEIC